MRFIYLGSSAASLAMVLVRTGLLGAVLLATPACSGPVEPAACDAEPVSQCIEPAPTYGDVAPIFDARCSGVECHSVGPSGSWPLETYQHVADWQVAVRDALLTCSMPPPDSGLVLPDDERQLILMWIRCGALE